MLKTTSNAFAATLTSADWGNTLTTRFQTTSRTFNLRKTISTLAKTTDLHKWAQTKPLSLKLPDLPVSEMDLLVKKQIGRLKALLLSHVTEESIFKVYLMLRLITSHKVAYGLVKTAVSQSLSSIRGDQIKQLCRVLPEDDN